MSTIPFFRNIALFGAFLFQLLSCFATDYCPMYNPITMNVRVLFVDNSCTYAMGNGDGSFETPYNNLNVAIAASAECDVIYVAPGKMPYDAFLFSSFSLLNNQRLLGTTTEAFQFCPGCPKPFLTNSGFGPVVTLSLNNEVSGFTIEPGLFGIGIQGTVSNFIATNNDFINVNNNGIVLDFTSTTSQNTATISNCTFSTSDNNANHILFPQSPFSTQGSGTVTINNNLFQGSYLSAIIVELYNSTISIFQNSITNDFAPMFPLGQIGGIIVSSPLSFLMMPPPSSSDIVTIANNVMQMASGSGINVSTSFGSICLTLTENKVKTVADTPGYVLNNFSSDGAFRCFDDFNLGTIKTNVSSAFITPIPFPITYTEACQ